MSATRFQATLAEARDDAALRALLKRIPLEGNIRVVFEREPSFWEAARLAGEFHQVIIGRDTLRDELVGMGTRSVTNCFVNGRAQPVGYLSDLRLVPEYRNATLLARGYRFLRELHADEQTQLYYTVIFADNNKALQTIAQGRAGLPNYHDMGLIHSPAIMLGRRKREVSNGATIVRGTPELLPGIVECLNRNNLRKQFAAVHAVADFCPGGRWIELKPDHFYVAMRAERIAGVIAKWDQRAFRQTRVVGYAPALKLARPFLNSLAPVIGMARLPPPGSFLDYFYAAFVAIDGDDVDVFRSLLRRVYNDSVSAGYQYFIIGLHERDPLAVALRDYRSVPFRGRLFCVSFEDGALARENLDTRLPCVEVATL